MAKKDIFMLTFDRSIPIDRFASNKERSKHTLRYKQISASTPPLKFVF